MAQKNKNGKSAGTKKSRKKATSPAKAVRPRRAAKVAAPETAERAMETPEETAGSTPPPPEDGVEVLKELMRMPTCRQMVIARLVKKLR